MLATLCNHKYGGDKSGWTSRHLVKRELDIGRRNI